MIIKNYLSRFVVPFYFDDSEKGYDKICAFFRDENKKECMNGLDSGKWVEAGFWENYKSSSSKQAEMELYTYLFSIFKEDEDKDLVNLGTSFVYMTDGKLFDANYLVKAPKENTKEPSSVQPDVKKYPFSCKDFGVLVLKDGIGFIWYEVVFNKSPETDIYTQFQYDFKELARTHATKFEVKVGFKEIEIDGKKRVNPIFEDFYLGKWIAEFLQIDELGIHFWAERDIRPQKEDETKKKNKTKKDFRDITYLKIKNGEENASKKVSVNYLPDKALPFQYVFMDDLSEEQGQDMVFQMANGYDSKYKSPNNLDDMIYKPFGNTSFYISKAGMACVVTNSGTNEAFFSGQFMEKFKRDYFFIYLLLCYQSYSCVRFSSLLTKLPAEEASFGKGAEFTNHLETLNSRINLFLVKSIFDSVSNVHHQNGVYRYGKEALFINDDIESLTIGLEALKGVVDEKNDRKLNNAITIFGFLVIISALFDGVSLVDWIVDKFCDGNKLCGYIGYGGLGIMVLLLAIYLMWVLCKSNRKK